MRPVEQGAVDPQVDDSQPRDGQPQVRESLIMVRSRDPLLVHPPAAADLDQWHAIGELLHGEQVELVMTGEAVLLPPAVRGALAHLVEALVAGHAVTCVPHPVCTPVDQQKQ